MIVATGASPWSRDTANLSPIGTIETPRMWNFNRPIRGSTSDLTTVFHGLAPVPMYIGIINGLLSAPL